MTHVSELMLNRGVKFNPGFVTRILETDKILFPSWPKKSMKKWDKNP